MRFRTQQILLALVVTGMIVVLHYIFQVVPNERIMGPVQRIFYFHVGAAVACYCSAAVVLVASLGYLSTRNWKWDVWLEAAGEVGFIFCTIVLASGMIWAKSAWNVWFRWEPRLVTFLLMWFIFLSFTLLRVFGDKERIAQHSAVLGLLGACTVPLVVFSIKFLPQFAQLHPQVVGNRGLRHPTFYEAMFLSMAVLVVFQFVLVWLRARLGHSERALNNLITYHQE